MAASDSSAKASATPPGSTPPRPREAKSSGTTGVVVSSLSYERMDDVRTEPKASAFIVHPFLALIGSMCGEVTWVFGHQEHGSRGGVSVTGCHQASRPHRGFAFCFVAACRCACW